MSAHPFKNYLRTSRKGLGLDQRHLADILGLRSMSRISAMENGLALPTVRECIVFQLLFNRSFEELWPHVALEVEVVTEANVRRLVIEPEKRMRVSERKRIRANIIRANLESLLRRLSTEHEAHGI
ncbi:MAG: helix-turn-helix transcriptional regulator [Candidatus Zambryskibacteria bacterium]|nr:helix-turn-helix transcriptional regulator [Candidatus Zambryskibacteria bacterium]